MASELELHTIGCAEAEILAQLAPAPVQCYGVNCRGMTLDQRAASELLVIDRTEAVTWRGTWRCYSAMA